MVAAGKKQKHTCHTYNCFENGSQRAMHYSFFFFLTTAQVSVLFPFLLRLCPSHKTTSRKDDLYLFVCFKGSDCYFIVGAFISKLPVMIA